MPRHQPAGRSGGRAAAALPPPARERWAGSPASRRESWSGSQLNTFAAERTQNVVIIAEASSDVGEPGTTPVDLAFRGSAAAARAYLAVRDRVGLVVYQRSAVAA